MNVGIIGAGIAGLSAAIVLASKGKQVTVYESSDKPGGKLNEKLIGAYRFDLGPSLFTMPLWVDELYYSAGKDPRDYYIYKKLEVSTHYFYEDGTTFKSSSNVNNFSEELKNQGIDTDNIKKYLKKVSGIYQTTEQIFLKSSIHQWQSYLHWGVLKSVFKLPFIKGMTTMAAMNKDYFKDPRLQQYFNRMATYNGSSPYQAPGTLNLISHIEHNVGAFFPEGGMYSITKGLYQLALDLGVKFEFNVSVDEIIVENNKAKGVRIGQRILPHEIVVSNMDVYFTYKKLMPKIDAPEKILNQEKSSSALIFYWGIKKEFKQLGLHNIFFAKNYDEEFKDIFEKKIPHHDPTVYINITSKECSSDAPASCENWFVMINVPNDSGQDWEELKKQAKQNIIQKLDRMLNADIASIIEVEEVLEPKLIEQRTSSFKGALYGNASNNKMAAFFRHANFSSKIKNLYFCGGSVHPGGGIPLALQSGKIVGDLIHRAYK
jgi:phytoene desaturase